MMSLRQSLLATNLAIAHVTALQVGQTQHALVPAVPGRTMDADNFVEWRLCDRKLDHSNLGGLGPDTDDPWEMRLSKAKTVGGVDLDLVVTLVDGSLYEANDVTVNRIENCFGYINVKGDSEAKLNFRFTKPGDVEPYQFDDATKFKFTVFDVDNSKTRDNKEIIIFNTPVDHLYLEDGHELERTGKNTPSSPLTFTSTEFGGGTDNPTDPESMNLTQRQRAVTVGYLGINQWTVTFKTTGGSRSGGRNFLWAGGSDVPEVRACQQWPEPTFPWSVCDEKTGNSKVITNNLGGRGPDANTPAEIRYGSVAKLHGKSMDLVVTTDDKYNPWNISRNTVINESSNASIHGCYGAINIRHESKVPLVFKFVLSGTDDLAKFDKDDTFGFTVYDLDNSKSSDNVELVTFDTEYVGGSAIFGSHVDEDGRTYRSTGFGKGSDNIFSVEDALRDEQADKSVAVRYEGTATWTVTFYASGGKEGRNILFGGCSRYF